MKRNRIADLLALVNERTDEFEYNKIVELLKLYFSNNKFSLIDVGSGLCVFAKIVASRFESVELSCLDINKGLVELAQTYGFDSRQGEITSLPFADNSADVTHCSHVIEHLKYPDIILALNELLRVTKVGGLIIIRSPLRVNHRFYNDIDHVRPYPPESIINYFSNEQQQVKGNSKIEEIDRWHTKIYCEIDPDRYPYKVVKYLNVFLKLSWLVFSFPFALPNNYGLVIRKVA